MKKQITTAAAIGALLAIACLFWEQQSAAWTATIMLAGVAAKVLAGGEESEAA